MNERSRAQGSAPTLAKRSSPSITAVLVVDLSTDGQSADAARVLLWRCLNGAPHGANVRLLVGNRTWPDIFAVDTILSEFPTLKYQVEGTSADAVAAWTRAIRNEPPVPWWEQDFPADPWCSS